ncbi:hypothetical protein [Streptomyces sp. NPDC004533]|uniref:hypothetical protein n=1 Tax=unclassified Streptomyces TaxID=2593676 RepID=UPI0033A41A5C
MSPQYLTPPISGQVIAQAGLAVRYDYASDTSVPFTYDEAPSQYYLPYGTSVSVYCWVLGPDVTGPYGTTNAWDMIEKFGQGHRTVASDAWIYTGGDVRNQLARC